MTSPSATPVPTTASTSTPVPIATATPVPPTPVPPTSIPPTSIPPVASTPGVVNTVELVAAKDNTLYQSSIGGPSNGAGEGLFVGATNNGPLRRALVQFDVASAVPAGATIESVEVSLSVTRTVTGGQPVALHRVTSDWGEGSSNAAAQEGRGGNAEAGDATWIHTFSPGQMWQTPGGDFIAAPSAQVNVMANASYTWGTSSELVADVQAWVDNPSMNFGWLLTGDEIETKSAKRFASREFGTESARPMLTIRFTPAS